MVNNIDKNLNESDILEVIREGGFFKEDSNRTYDFSGDVVDACIDSARFADPLSLEVSIQADVLKFLDGKDEELARFNLAKLDTSNVLLAYLVSCRPYSSSEISRFIESEDDYLISVGSGLAVMHSCPQLIPASSYEGLYKYFRSHKITENSFSHFSSKEFVKYSFTKMLKEENVIFTWMINNLESLVAIDAIKVEEHHDSFVKLLRGTDYPNETHKDLFVLAIEKAPDLINEIVKMRLEIDPFTKQSNYTKWLQEVRMFKFVSDLRDSLPEKYTSNDVYQFDKCKVDLYEINKGDSSLLM